MALPTGARLGSYEIRGPLGAGGMGEVYRAWDARLGREVAVKVLPPASLGDPDRLRRFEQEARAAGALNHPNVLAVYDVGSHESLPYIVSELLEGDTLRGQIRAGGLTPRKAVEHAVQIARGLAAAHRRGIVHRDLKPENVFVTRDGHVKLLDFGLAKLRNETPSDAEAATATRETRPGVVMGTIPYLSPEQVRGLPADARSDIFALGATLYEMLAGRRPFTGETTAEIETAILRAEPPELSTIDAQIPTTLDRLVRRCLEKRPEDRFQTAQDVAFALEAMGTGTTTGPSPRRLFVWDVAMSAPPRALSPEGDIGNPVVSPDGRSVLASVARMGLMQYPVDSGPGGPVRGSAVQDEPLRWSSDGRWLFVRRSPWFNTTRVWINRIEMAAGRREPWKELTPADPAGVNNIWTIDVRPDGKSYVYAFDSALGDLYLAEGLK